MHVVAASSEQESHSRRAAGHGTRKSTLRPQSVTHLAIKADQHPAFHGWDGNMIKVYSLSRIAPGTRALLRARAARGRRGTGRGSRRRRAGPGRGRRRRLRRLYGRAFDIAVVGTGRLAVVAAPQAGFERQRARRQGGSRRRRTQFRRSGRTERPRHQLSRAEPAALRQQAAARPDPRLSACAA